MGWTPDQLPDQTGKTFAITGGNSGLGLEAAKLLAARGARVVITSRREDNANAALAEIREAAPNADVDWVQLDLADLDNVARAAAEIREKCPQLDGFINNAGVMQTPNRKTAQGFELQIGTNHLGHFKLNSLLMDHFEACGTRIVAVSSIAHKFGAIHLSDLNFESRRYDPSIAYGQSKLANILYGFELQRRLAARGSKATAYAAHPGYAATNLQTAGVGMEGGSKLLRGLYAITNKVMAQTATEGAYPLVLAAAAPDAKPGAYYGPTGFYQYRGPVGESYIHPKAKDEAVARGLWELSEELVGPFFS
ncbi:MAG: SDR family NAD(P)-dependent oxidoreductase [Deltaproteobacteria bacterium]|nr:MAG: SDR family NAD(P)-dependent oxidoreductase [Deltaproteobacteria bacterium]